MLTQFSITPEDFRDTLKRAKANRPILYHVGLLMEDRLNNEKVEAIGRLAAAMSDLGLVRLYQKREKGLMHYYATPIRKLTRTESRSSLSDAERLAQWR